MPRRAIATDVPGIATLYHSVWHETQAPFMPGEEIVRRNLAFFEDRMTRLIPSTLVVERNRAIADFSSWSGDLLEQIFVATPYRGSGLATDLMAATEKVMSNDSVAVSELHCVVGNHRARRCYERMGWRHEGEIAEKVAGPGGESEVPFWCMRKQL